MEYSVDSECEQEDFLNVSIRAIGPTSLQIISKLLNPLKVIPTEDKLQRDWQGLAELINLNGEDISSLHSTSDPTRYILEKWSKHKDSTIRKLITFLEKLDRFDIVDDINETIANDVANFNRINVKKPSEACNTDIIIESDILNSLRKEPLIHYNAYLLYANEDIEFAKMVVTTMEDKYHLNLFVKDRDLIAGVVQYTAMMKVIADRCDRLIVILSPAFVQSAENKYFISFAQSIGIEYSRHKIIPCLYQHCTIPSDLKPLYMLDYTRAGVFFDFYEKLYKSIINPLNYDYEPLPTRSGSVDIVQEKLQNDLPRAVSKSNPNLAVEIPEYKKSKSKVKKLLKTLHITKDKKTKLKQSAQVQN